MTSRTFADLALCHFDRGEYDAAARVYRRAVHLARQEGETALGIRLLRLSSLFYAPRRAVREITRALEEARRQGIEREVAFCHNDRGVALLSLAGFEPARADFQRSAEILDRAAEIRNGVPWNNLGLLEILSGQPEAADGPLHEACSRGGEPAVAVAARGHQALLRALRGDTEGAAADLAALTREVPGHLPLRCRLAQDRARALLSSGDPEEAWNEAMACPAERHLINDELIEGRRARLLLDILEALGEETKSGEAGKLREQARILETSIHPQAWFFRSPWAYFELAFR